MFFVLLISFLVSSCIYVLDKEITTKEFLLTLLFISLSVFSVYGISVAPIQNAKFFQSGRVVKTVFHPYFVEEYQQPHTICTPSGKSVSCTTYYTTEYEKHKAYWTDEDSLGQTNKISRELHERMKKDFGNKVTISRPNKCTNGGRIVSGDPNLYTYNNITNSYDYPTTLLGSWHNPIKGRVSIFNRKGKEEVRKYPTRLSHLSTNRAEEADGITKTKWDTLNTKVYEKVGANLILVKINDSQNAINLENAWLSGSKNDLVICVRGSYKAPSFVKVFGWTKSAYVKRALETFILENGVDIEGIEEIVSNYYEPYEFSKLDYLTKPPSVLTIIIAFVVAMIVGFICYSNFAMNYERKEE